MRARRGQPIRARAPLTERPFRTHNRGGRAILIDKIFRIARAEYLNSITSKAFVIGVLATPMMIGAMLLVEGVSERAKGGEARRVDIVDGIGRLAQALAPSFAALVRWTFPG